MKNRFEKLKGHLPGDGIVFDKVLKKTYRMRSDWEVSKLVDHINHLLKEIEERKEGKKDD